MKITKTASGKKTIRMSKSEWLNIGRKSGWLATAKKKKQYKHSPKEHGFIDECIGKNKDKDDPGAYCASIVDKAKGTTDWRKGPKKSGSNKAIKEAKWGEDIDVEQPGKWTDYTKQELIKKRDAARKRQENRKKDGKKADPKDTELLRELNFAIRAKGDWGKAD